jgi:E2/UBC family protein E
MSFLPKTDVAYLEEKGIAYEEVEENRQKAIIPRAFGLPPARFDASQADILIVLPPGYPDVPPDMFYLLP